MTLKKYKIYLITNIVNNKVYVGFTKDIEKRFLEHKKGVKTRKVGAAMLELGADKFSITIIDSTDCMFEALYVLEPYWIGFYNSINNGYNGSIKLARPVFYGATKKFFNSHKAGYKHTPRLQHKKRTKRPDYRDINFNQIR